MSLLKSLALLLLFDSIYIYFILNSFQQQIYQVQHSKMQLKITGAILCYAALIICFHYFITRPKKSVQDAFILGSCIYLTYNATNYATLKNWSPYLLMTDTIWGGILFALTRYFSQ